MFLPHIPLGQLFRVRSIEYQTQPEILRAQLKANLWTTSVKSQQSPAV